MNKLSTAALLSLIGLGMATQQASAQWCCKERCRERYCNNYRVIVHKSQYNAFSPFCVDSVRYKGHFGMSCLANQCGNECGGNACFGPSCEGGFMGTLPQQAPGAGLQAPMPTQPGQTMLMTPPNYNFAGFQPQMYQPNYNPGY